MIALITPTGARPGQFALCQMFMQRQTYAGEVAWVIVDDAQPRSTNAINGSFKPSWTIIKVYPEPPWRIGQNTQGRNIEAAVNALLANYAEKDIEAIFIIEDDDYYRPQYLDRMMQRFADFKVLGEMNTVYYNVFFRTYFINRNTSHVSLFQLAFRPEMIPLFASCYGQRFIDFKFYEKLHAQLYVHRGEVGFFNEGNLAIGMKGMPGRAGIGAGHGKLLNMLPDQAMLFLTQQIQDDAKLYEGYYGNHGLPQHRGLNERRL
jgi:hypothetical protein